MGEKVGNDGENSTPDTLSASSATPSSTLDDDPYGLRQSSDSGSDGSYDATDGNDAEEK
jgi:hypothetical protein